MAETTISIGRLAASFVLAASVSLVAEGFVAPSGAAQVRAAAMSSAEEENAVSDIQSDLQLKTAVHNELIWSGLIGLAGIDVYVDGGVVTFTGFVPTVEARNAATRSALRAGATDVNNLLRVRVPR